MYTLNHYTCFLQCNELGCTAGADIYTWHNFEDVRTRSMSKRERGLFHLHVPLVGACSKLHSASIYKLVPTMQASKYGLPEHNQPNLGSFCEYRTTNDVKRKEPKTENNRTPKQD